LFIQDLEPPQWWWNTIVLSKNGRFLCENTSDTIKIYALTTIKSFDKHLCFIINETDSVCGMQMDGNILYYILDEKLHVVDIKALTVSTLSIMMADTYYVHKGIICILKDAEVVIYDISGAQYIIPIPFNFGGHETFEDGILNVYLSDGKLHTIDIETKTHQISDKIIHIYSAYPTSYGNVYVGSERNTLILPQGKIINSQNISEISGIFQPKMSTNNNILMCYLETDYYNFIIFIDLDSETIKDTFQFVDEVDSFGFLEPSFVSQVIEPVLINCKDLKKI
jgi:hypothetical protein